MASVRKPPTGLRNINAGDRFQLGIPCNGVRAHNGEAA